MHVVTDLTGCPWPGERSVITIGASDDLIDDLLHGANVDRTTNDAQAAAGVEGQGLGCSNGRGDVDVDGAGCGLHRPRTA